MSRSRPFTYTPHPTPCTRHPTLCTRHPELCTLHPAPCTLHPAPYTLHPTPCTLHSAPCTLHSAPYTLSLTPYPAQSGASEDSAWTCAVSSSRTDSSSRSSRFFELPTQADSRNCSVERPCFLADHIRPPCTEHCGNRLEGILNRRMGPPRGERPVQGYLAHKETPPHRTLQ